jgi:hypothetical protein
MDAGVVCGCEEERSSKGDEIGDDDVLVRAGAEADHQL